MGKLAGNKTSLLDFRGTFSLTARGRVFSLAKGLVLQQKVDTSGDQLLVGGSLTTVAGSYSDTAFQPSPTSPTGMRGAKFNSANTQISFDNVAVGQLLNFTSKELTVSMWLSGSTVAKTSLELSQSCRLRSSGTNGVQFAMGAIDFASYGRNALYAAAVLSEGSANYVATTGKTVDLEAYQIVNEAYIGRHNEVTNTYFSFGLRSAVDVLSRGWHHVVYVQRAAEDPEPLEYSTQFGRPISQKYLMSKTGKEGRCEMWLDGELVYSSPPWGPFPRGFSPYFYESGLDGLNGSTDAQGLFDKIKKRALRQSAPVATLSGSSTKGDAIAQLAIWQRCLSEEEIRAIYAGTQGGIFATQETSTSLLPKRLIDPSGVIYEPALNDGYPDTSLGISVGAFTDKEVSAADNNVYQDNFFIESSSPSLTLNNTTERGKVKKYQAASFSDREDRTSYVSDPEFVIPSGSSEIKISLPNVTNDAYACRYQYDGRLKLPDLLNTKTKSIVGTGFLYYSPQRKSWIEKRPDSSTSQFSINSATVNDYSASNFLEQSQEYLSFDRTAADETESNPLMLTNRVLSQFAWSPQFGYFVHHKEHLQQAGYERIGWPTGMFAAPNAPKYHGYDGESFKMKDFINKPFLLKKIILRIPVEARRKFGANPAGPSGKSWDLKTRNKKDIDNYTFFVYRQRRLSKNKDSFDDRTTSKRYLIASASVCYYNSASFGGAWADGYYTNASSPWSKTINSKIYDGIAKPDHTSDFFGQSLTKINESNVILHNPQYAKNWGIERLSTYDSVMFDSQRLELEMFPTVVPACSVAPSLMPITGGEFYDTSVGGATKRFNYREGGPDPAASTILACYQYVTSGTRDIPDNGSPAPYLTLVSNFWFGGSRPPTVASYSNANWSSTEVSIPDAYDSVGSPFQISGRGANPKPGQVDIQMQMAPTYTSGVVYFRASEFSADNILDSLTRFTPIRGPVQSHGVSFIPSFSRSGSNAQVFDIRQLRYQQPIDPQSINASMPGSQFSLPKFYGRKTYNDAGANGWSTEHHNKYMGYYGWRFISSFQKSDFTEQQIYSPVLLDPDDELILGLDAGTFGPPDIQPDSLIPDGIGPTEGLAHGVGLGWGATSRSDKETFLKEDYAITMSDSSLRILSGDAEIILIGDFLQDGAAIIPTRDAPVSSNVNQGYGTEPIGDQYLLYNADLLSGSLFTRVFTGSEGPDGLLQGNSDDKKARRYYYDAGARKSY